MTELLKILPGFAIAQNSGSVTNSAYDPSNVSITGSLGQYAANGSPTNGISLLSDGANLTDPGNNGSAVQNVNYDMTEEVKVQTSNFGADIANGPVVINAVGKAGTDHYHGELYVYGRTNQLNSQDPLTSGPGLGKPQDREIYPGGNISGPFRIPGTKINKSNRVTYFIGAEDYAQRNVFAYGSASSAVFNALVPTQAMRNGDFSAASLQQYLGSSYNNSNYVNINSVPTFAPNGGAVANGNIAPYLDPGAMAIINSLPLPNETNTTGYNYHGEDLTDNDLWQVRGRTDIAINNNNKIFGVYNVEHGRNSRPQSIYYAPGAGTGVAMGGVNTPGSILENINSETASFDLTSTIGASRTNELYANLTYLNDTFGSGNLAAEEANYPYKGIYNNGTRALPQVGDYGYDGMPLELSPDFTTISSGIFAHKFIPAVGDNFTQVVRSHTFRVGTFVQRVENNEVQPNLNLPGGGTCVACSNGLLSMYYYPAAGSSFTNPDGSTFTTSGNYLANFAEGAVQEFQQVNFTPAQNLYFWNIDGYVTDTWKATKRLQLELGVRLEHLGQWQDAHGIGAAVWMPSQYTNTSLAEPGVEWHGINSAIPNSGAPTRALFVEPRLGFSYDVFGTGKTIVRGGFGQYRTHDNWNDISPAFATGEGSHASLVGGGGITLAAINSSYNLPTNAGIGSAVSSVNALNPTDDEEPLTNTYSFTVSQQLPYSTLLQVSYVGNNSQHLINDVSNGGADLENINALPIGSLYKPNPVTGVTVPIAGLAALETATINQYRPFPLYSSVNVPQHVLASNYNGLQLSLERRSGHAIFGVNYTLSKSLGDRGGYYNGPAIDPTNQAVNYGIMSYDRAQVFNSSYSYDFGSRFHERLAAAFGNGWQLSGITSVQSGPNLQAISSSADFGLTVHAGGTTVANTTMLGTPDVELIPNVTCNPGIKLNASTYINSSCFSLAPLGQNGNATDLSSVRGPGYLDTDLTATKTIHLHESQALQLRFEAFNFVNHPLTTFVGTGGALNLTLNSNQTNPALLPGSTTPATGFGTAVNETGRRVVEAAIKYTF